MSIILPVITIKTTSELMSHMLKIEHGEHPEEQLFSDTINTIAHTGTVELNEAVISISYANFCKYNELKPALRAKSMLRIDGSLFKFVCANMQMNDEYGHYHNKYDYTRIDLLSHCISISDHRGDWLEDVYSSYRTDTFSDNERITHERIMQFNLLDYLARCVLTNDNIKEKD